MPEMQGQEIGADPLSLPGKDLEKELTFPFGWRGQGISSASPPFFSDLTFLLRAPSTNALEEISLLLSSWAWTRVLTHSIVDKEDKR